MTTSYRPCGHIFVVVAVVIGITEATQPRFTVVQNGDEDPEVETEYGRVRGVRELDAKSGRHVTAFYGIPFATPPVEEFRFRPPYPAKPWTDTYDCTKKKVGLGSPLAVWSVLTTVMGAVVSSLPAVSDSRSTPGLWQ